VDDSNANVATMKLFFAPKTIIIVVVVVVAAKTSIYNNMSVDMMAKKDIVCHFPSVLAVSHHRIFVSYH
jgi:hypothetical protein